LVSKKKSFFFSSRRFFDTQSSNLPRNAPLIEARGESNSKPISTSLCTCTAPLLRRPANASSSWSCTTTRCCAAFTTSLGAAPLENATSLTFMRSDKMSRCDELRPK